MRINSFYFFDKFSEWKLETIKFDALTLLIGASGVGKTMILDAINTLVQIANGKSINGVEWKIEFEVDDSQNYIWEGTFETKNLSEELFSSSKDDDLPEQIKATVLKENLSLNGTPLVERTRDKIIFKEKETPKLSQQESIIKLLKEEPDISPAYSGLNKIIAHDYSEPFPREFAIKLFDFQGALNKFKSLKSIQNVDIDIMDKLYLAYKNVPLTFNKIKDRYIEFFPHVENIKIEPLDWDHAVPHFLEEHPFLHIKEKGVKKWISQNKISLGMLKTLLHISELYLISEGSVILIDEFENSLGVNCIDDLTEELLAAGRNLQFIITSHHPFIINSISFKHWKLVTRNAGVVSTLEPETLNLGKSKHDAFIQLINLEHYKNGIRSEVE